MIINFVINSCLVFYVYVLLLLFFQLVSDMAKSISSRGGLLCVCFILFFFKENGRGYKMDGTDGRTD